MKNRFYKLMLCVMMVAWMSVAAEAEVKVTVKQYQVPVLVGKVACPILHLEIEVPKDQYPTVNALRLTSEETTRVSDLQHVKLYSTGTSNKFAAKQESGMGSKETGGVFVIDTSYRLEPGKNHLWVACQLKETADITGKVDLQCEKLVVDGDVVKGVKDESGKIVQRAGIAVREVGDDGVHTYRIPGITRTPKGTLLSVYDVRRKSSRDLQGDMDIGLSRSTDGGRTWEAMRIVMDMKRYGGLPESLNGCSDACILVDENTGDVYVFAVWMHGVFEQIRGKDSWIHQWHKDCPGPGFGLNETSQMLMVKSSDDGKTWGAPVNLTKMVKKKEWKLFAPGPGNGITLKEGTLVIPAQGRDAKNVPFSCIMYSKDHGKTWEVSERGLVTPLGTTESAVVELSDGRLMLNMRDNRNRNNGPGRSVATTKDLGESWKEHETSANRTLVSPRCMGSLRTVPYQNKALLFFSNPATTRGRNHMTLKLSVDDGASWPEVYHTLLDEWNSFGYSCITPVDDKHVSVFYEGSQAHMTYQLIPIEEILGRKKN